MTNGIVVQSDNAWEPYAGVLSSSNCDDACLMLKYAQSVHSSLHAVERHIERQSQQLHFDLVIVWVLLAALIIGRLITWCAWVRPPAKYTPRWQGCATISPSTAGSSARSPLMRAAPERSCAGERSAKPAAAGRLASSKIWAQWLRSHPEIQGEEAL